MMHHVDCPKCHGNGSYFEECRIKDGKIRSDFVFNCDCFKHISEPVAAPGREKDGQP